MVSVMLLWGVCFAALGWLVFKIAERMCTTDQLSQW